MRTISWATAFAFVMLSIACVVLSPRTAHAQKVSDRTVDVLWKSGVPHLSFSTSDMAGKKIRKKLKSGLPQRVVTQVYAYKRKSSSKPLAVSVRSCRIVYDLWEEVYRIQVQTDKTDRAKRAKTQDAAIQYCFEFSQHPLGETGKYSKQLGKKVYFAVQVEINPLSDDTVKRIRRWLARGDQLEGDAFFGSFVSMFVNRNIGRAEKVLRFKSQNIEVPE